MGADLLERLTLAADLRRAIESDEMVVHYQPVIALGSGSVTGFEALVRWQHPERGLILPERFISLAEENGQIVTLGTRVLEIACRQMREWQLSYPSNPPLTISVNVSGRQIRDAALPDDVARILAQTGLAPEHLVLELTESLFIDESSQTVELLEALKALGVRLAIDDFGKGYSSLNYLQRLPVDKLKIDKSFIDAVHTGEAGAAVAETIIRLAHTFGLETIAEGVELQQQVDSLRDLGCEEAQGYRFARPLNAEQAGGLLDELCADPHVRTTASPVAKVPLPSR